jgi:hypothetical protein
VGFAQPGPAESRAIRIDLSKIQANHFAVFHYFVKAMKEAISSLPMARGGQS